MTPERIEELRDLRELFNQSNDVWVKRDIASKIVDALPELLAEIESLTRELEQAEEALERRPDNQIERNKTT